MSELRVDNIVSENGSAAPVYSKGMTIGAGQTLTCAGDFTVGGDVTFNSGATVTGVVTFSSADLQTNLSVSSLNSSGIVTASSFSGDGSALTGLASDAISEGNTSVECVDTGSDGHITFDTEGTEAARFDSSGRLLIGGTTARSNFDNYTNSAVLQIEGVTSDQDVGISVISNANSQYYQPRLRFAKSRGTSLGSNTIVQSNDFLGVLSFQGSDGSEFVEAGSIRCEVAGTPGANDMPGRLIFSTTADGAAGPTDRLRLEAEGYFVCQGVYDLTTSAGANVYVHGNGYVQRSTSSIKYKTDVETLEDSYADALLECRPVWYRSICSTDDPAHGYWGFIAEEVAEIDPRLVHWKTVEVTYDENGSAVETPCEPEPEGVQYDRFVPHLINLVKRQKEQLESQAASIASLEARLTALEGA